MKTFKEQLTIPEYTWLFNSKERRKFCVVGKIYEGSDDTFRVKAYELLEVDKPAPIKVAYELMEQLLESNTLVQL